MFLKCKKELALLHSFVIKRYKQDVVSVKLIYSIS